MELFKFYLLSFFVIIVIFTSCNSASKDNQILFESVSLSNNYYDNSIMQLKDYFEMKSLDQPAKYASDYKKMREFEKKIDSYYRIVGIDNKKRFINELNQQLINEQGNNVYIFVCLKVDNNEKIFDSIAKNDFKRILLQKYTTYYYIHHRVY